MTRLQHRIEKLERAALGVLGVLGVLGALWSAQANAAVIVTITGNTTATAAISLPRPGGGADYQATLRLDFEGAQSLTEACLGISAEVLDAAGTAAVNARLPVPANEALDPAFPIMVTVAAPAACGLSFQNELKIELHTPELVYVAFSPYRLFKSPDGGPFLNITSEVSSGSVRTRGAGGSLSQFVIAKLLVQDYTTETDDHYEDLDRDLSRPTLSASAREALRIDLAVSRAAFESGDITTALGHAIAIENRLRRLAGEGVPNRWRAQRDLVDDEGELLSEIQGLKFTLGRLSGTP